MTRKSSNLVNLDWYRAAQARRGRQKAGRRGIADCLVLGSDRPRAVVRPSAATMAYLVSRSRLLGVRRARAWHQAGSERPSHPTPGRVPG